jgi:glycine C-acetyltransferase
MALPAVFQSQNGAGSGPLTKSVAHFARPSGRDLLTRTETFLRWQDGRRDAEVWPYSRALLGAPQPSTRVQDERGRQRTGINFASQDYLGLSTHPDIQAEAMRALQIYGPHSASSPMLQGNTGLSLRLEEALAELVQMEEVVLFSTGWGAGFGTITALVRPDDHVILDNLAHACLQQGAQAATQNVRRHDHLDVAAVRRHLQEIRAQDNKNGILVVTEGLFSMDSDTPDLKALQDLCHEYEATLLVDVAHDLGAMGPNGTGQIGLQDMLGKVDLVVGAFSKTFASNGGFLATNSRAVKQYVKTFGGPHIFSNGLSPVQAAVVLEAVRLVQSAEGECLRANLRHIVHKLRFELAEEGIACLGIPSAVVPVPIGNEKVGRLASAALFRRGIFANLVEFPAVAVGSARFRMQAMATHTDAHVCQAVCAVVASIEEAREAIESPEPYALVPEREINREEVRSASLLRIRRTARRAVPQRQLQEA